MKQQPDITEESPQVDDSLEALQQWVAALEALVATLQSEQVNAFADAGGIMGSGITDGDVIIPAGRVLPAGNADYQVLIWDENDWTGDGDNPKWKVDYPRVHDV